MRRVLGEACMILLSGRFTDSKESADQGAGPQRTERVQESCEDGSFWNTKNTRNGRAHYFLEKRACLDAPGGTVV